MTDVSLILSRLTSGNLKARQTGKASVKHGSRSLSVALLTCSDERIVPEVIFDQPPGTFYAVRLAGAIYSPEAAGSLEVAVVRHRCPLILVLGHTGCSAVRMTVDKDRAEGALYELVRHIKPVLEGHPQDADAANVLNTVKELRQRCRSLREREERGELRIAGAIYDMASGEVSLLT